MEPAAHPATSDRAIWLGNVRRSFFIAAVILILAFIVGLLGYHIVGGLAWADAARESAMILMGKVSTHPMASEGLKLFSAFYAVFSGLIFLCITAFLIRPWLQHALAHRRRIKKTNHSA